MDEFCGQKEIKREYSIARTPQQNGVAERNNKTLIEAARTMLADSLLPIVFWAEAVNTACYVLNRVLVTKPHNKTPYELIIGRAPSISFMRPFGCRVTILNTLDPLGKFDGKAEEEFLVGHSVNSKAFRVFNTETRKVEENLHVNFLENKPNVAGQGPHWLFDIDSLTNSMNYQPDDTVNDDACKKTIQEPASEHDQALKNVLDKMMDQEKEATEQSDAVRKEFEAHTGIFGNAYDDHDLETLNTPYADQSVGAEADFNNMEPSTVSALQTRGTTKKNSGEHAMISYIQKQRRKNHKDFQNCLFACFLSQHEPTKISQALDDESWVKAMQEELLQFKIQKAPRAWYETLSTYLMDNGFHMGQIDKTLFIKRLKGDILLVQVYVDDIIFGSTKKSLCDKFEQIMHNRFQMSSMGALTFFLGLQVKQKEDVIFISQDKYVGEILKKFGFFSIRSASTPMETHKALTKDKDGEDVDVHLYRSMIGSLMYLTSSRPDIMFSVCACSRFQVQPKVSHLNAVKRIFRYLKGQPKLGLWYPKDSPLILEAFSDSDYACASLDRKSTTGGKRGRDTKIPQSGGPPIKVGDEVVYKELGDRMERAATAASSFEAEQDSSGPRTTTARTRANGEVELTATIDGQVKTITEASLRRHLKLEDNGGITTLPNSEIFKQLSLMGAPETSQSRITSSPSLSPQHTPKVEGLEFNLKQIKQTYSIALTKFILRVKKLEQIMKASKSRRMARIDQDPSISLVHDEGTSWIQEDIEIQEKISNDTEVVLEEEEPTELVEDQVSIAAANLVYIRRSAHKRKDKGKAIMEEDESVQKKIKKHLEQERLGHEEAIRLQEQLNKEETQRITRDVEIARHLHEEINKARKERVVAKDDQAHVIDWSDPAVLRYHAQLNRPYSVAEVRKNMVMYLKNQGGYKMNYFKGMKYEDIKPIFEKE
ncbi:uncharacterized mitochondrial protein-like protein [Tanacetum coccineum]